MLSSSSTSPSTSEVHFIRAAQPARRRRGGAGMVEDEMSRAALEIRGK